MTAWLVGPPRVFDGWKVVAAVFVLLMIHAGLGFYGLAVFLEAITEEQGLSTTSVSFATSIYFVTGAAVGRIIAPLIERRDIRLVVGAGGVIAAIGLWFIGQATDLTSLYASYILFAVGTAMSGLVPGTTLITRWFQTRRSVALSIASTGLSVGGLTITVAAAQLIDSRGMRAASPWLAMMYLVFVGISLLGLWPDPTARGQRPDGAGPDDPGASATLNGTTYEEAVRSRFFILVTAAFVATMGAQVGGIAHLAKLGTERANDGTGTLLLSTIALTSVLARLAGGVAAGRVQLLRLTAAFSLAQALALLWLSLAPSQTLLILGAIFFGATIGNLLMLHPLLLADQFGVANYPRIFSLSQLIMMGLGVAGGPYLLGALHDLVNYRASYLVAAALSTTGGAIFFAAR